jgi:hypothetical protein
MAARLKITVVLATTRKVQCEVKIVLPSDVQFSVISLTKFLEKFVLRAFEVLLELATRTHLEVKFKEVKRSNDLKLLKMPKVKTNI